MTYTETDRDNETAMVFLDTWGSTTYPPTPFDRWKWTEDGAPEWLSADDLSYDQDEYVEKDECITVLDFSLSEPEPPTGYRLAYQYAAGERECPWCGCGTGEEHSRSECKLCEGSGYLYWGEECQVVVFAPLISNEQFEAMTEGLFTISEVPSNV